jgi:hypothetical protein
MKQIIFILFVSIPVALFGQRNVNTVDTLPVKIFVDNNVLGKSVNGFVVINGRKRHLLDADKTRIKNQRVPYAINCQKCPDGFSYIGGKTARFVAGKGVEISQRFDENGDDVITISAIKN